MERYMSVHRAPSGETQSSVVLDSRDYANQFDNFNQIDLNVGPSDSTNIGNTHSHPQHNHPLPSSSSQPNSQQQQVLASTPIDGTSFVPYYHNHQIQHNHPPPPNGDQYVGQYLYDTASTPNNPAIVYPMQQSIETLPSQAQSNIQTVDYFQRRANSIEVPPNVTINFTRNIPEQHQLHAAVVQSPRQLLQAQDGTSVPIDTSGMVRIKRWKIFPGRNRFFCDGRLVMAKEPAVFAFTVILLCGTFSSFVYYDCPYLGRQVSWAIPVCGSLLFVFVVTTLLRTTFTDPGIIPRATPEEALAFEQFSSGNNPSPTYRPPPRTKEVIIRNQPVKLKYCFTCKILRPPRASHCSLCDNCVERFDHHCPWVGNCVGRRNYRFFYLFIVSLAFLTVYVFSCVVTHLTLLSNESSLTDAIKTSPASMVVAIICFFSMWSIIGLAGFHTYLILNNLTTNEDIKGSFSSKRSNSIKNPYTGTSGENCVEILCSPLTPSLLKSRSFIYCDEQKVASRRRRKSSCSADSPIPPPPIRSTPYPMSTHPQMSYSVDHAQHQNAQHLMLQQQVSRNSHSMQNMAGSFSGATPPMSMRVHQHQHHQQNESQHRTLPHNRNDHSPRVRYECPSVDLTSSGNAFFNQNFNRLTHECVSANPHLAYNQQHQQTKQSKTQPGKHYST